MQAPSPWGGGERTGRLDRVPVARNYGRFSKSRIRAMYEASRCFLCKNLRKASKNRCLTPEILGQMGLRTIMWVFT